jgi:hypothetical protein
MSHSVIHIGANKTASTTLQRHLFRGNSELQYLGEDGDGYAQYASLLSSLVNDDDLFYSAEICTKLFSDNKSKAGVKTLLFSSEDVMTSRIPLICAKRLQILMPEAEVVLVMRNQLTAVPSFYANHGAFLKPAPPAYFRRHVAIEDWMAFETMFGKYGALASFRYDQFESIYSSLFGGRIHILLFEEFITDRKAFVEKLSKILRIDSNLAMQALKSSHERRRFSARMLAYNRFRTSFFWNMKFTKFLPFGSKLALVFDNFLSKGVSADIRINLSTQEKICKLYCEGNTRLAEKYGLPLERFGYPLVGAVNNV